MIIINKEEIETLIRTKKSQISSLLDEISKLEYEMNQNKKTNISIEEKIKVYSDYFRGRDDVYPYLSIDKKDSSKKYYIPACLNEWKTGICNKTMGKPCKTCQYREDKPLSYEVIRNHIYSNHPIGLYPILDDDTCYFLVFDFDDKKNETKIKEDILAFTNICDKYNIPVSLERSRSGKGIHAWIFFECKIKALNARKLGSLLLSKTMEIRDSLSIESFDRMFPSQDYLPKGGYGNLIALPFQNEPSKYGNTTFIDRNFMQIQSQFDYLCSIKKLKQDEVFEAINILSNETIDISHEDLDIKKEIKNKSKNKFAFPKVINVVLEDMIYIDKANLSSAVKNSFRRLASFANPEFYKKQRLRMSVYNIPMVIDCSKETEKYLKLPRGTFEYLNSLCNEQHIKMNIIDKRNTGEKHSFKFNGKLYEEQKNALSKIMEYDNGILYAPTGFGKTVICCNLIAERGVNTLIITEKLQILRQ